MDRETRFLVVSKLTTNRDADATIAAFEEAKAHAHGIKPKTVFTDSLGNYKNGIRKNFMGVEHVANCGIRGVAHTNNNRIERLNSTLRERVKVSRGWKTAKTPMAGGNRIQYNFVKPHMALDGKTPASAAGIDIKGWKELLEKAVKRR